jgi:hypothetical protein
MRQGFLRRLPRPVRWLWFAILAVAALECAALALGIVLGGAWLSTAFQLSSLLAVPMALGLLVVVATSRWTGRRPSPPDRGRSEDEQPAPGPPSSSVPLEVAAGRRAGQAAAALARSREGKAAIRQTARFVRAVRAAAQPAPESTGTDEPERRSGSESQEARRSPEP